MTPTATTSHFLRPSTHSVLSGYDYQRELWFPTGLDRFREFLPPCNIARNFYTSIIEVPASSIEARVVHLSAKDRAMGLFGEMSFLTDDEQNKYLVGRRSLSIDTGVNVFDIYD